MAIDIYSVKLTDLISADTLQKIQDAFSDATGMAALATDMEGSVTHLSNPTHFCMNLTRPTKVGGDRCNMCDLKGGAEAAKTGRPSVYYCHGGLVDFAAPIIVNGRHIGSLIGGQVLPEPPDLDKFRKIAREIGANEDEYIKAIKKIKIVPKDQIDKAANLLFAVANSLSESGYQRLVAAETAKQFQSAMKGMLATTDEINNVMQDVTTSVNELQKSFDEFIEALGISLNDVKKSDNVISYIKDISMQLTLLGFNASVEARKAGSHGLGFNSIAQEIRRLSDETSMQTQLVEDMLTAMKRSMTGAQNTFQSTDGVLQNCIGCVEKLAATSERIMDIVQQLKDASEN
jgi:ligand-binding sensor protein